MLIPPNYKFKADRVDAFASLADYNAALAEVIAAGDEHAQHDLIYNFTIGPDGARRIAWEEWNG